MFNFTTQPIISADCILQLSNPACGAVVTFEGLVRNHNDGLEVQRLEYEAFTSLAEKLGMQIVQEAKDKFSITKAVCIHRLGSLEIGDIAVWIGVNAAHRKAAFEACQYIIDEIKTRVPIWKKEHYADGTDVWVNCTECARHSSHEVTGVSV
jgi:molybdopterin synthase catalytic subunit